MKVLHTPLAGVMVIETTVVQDHRGEFARLYCEREMESCVGGRRIVQANRSVTHARGTVRGLHYQRPPFAETKFIRCLRGRIWDVAVDLRAGSSTFRRWFAQELSAETALMLVVPEGCAHGFQVLEDGSELLYLHTAFYEKSAEGGIAPEDPALGIAWPLPVSGLSERDRSFAPLTTDFHGVSI